MKKFDFVVVIHRLYYNGQVKKGGLDLVLDYLKGKNQSILLIEFPLDYRQTTEVRVSGIVNGVQQVISVFKMPSRIGPLNWVLELFLALFHILRTGSPKSRVISSDPLTTLPAVILRKLGYFVFHYYHSVDYSTGRFNNPLFNGIYTFLLVLGLRMADVVGVVTPKAKERLQKYNVKEFVYIPNSPDFNLFGKYRMDPEKRAQNSLVLTCCEISPKFKVFELLELTSRLREVFPDITINLIGYYDVEGEYFHKLSSYIKDNNLENNVVFHGSVSRELNYEIIGECMIGLAFYDADENSHVRYGDSLKIREYSALGLVTVSDKATSTALEMTQAQAGYSLDSINEAEDVIMYLFRDFDAYKIISSSAIDWAKRMDKTRIMDDFAKRYLGI
jgi:glycosyltransferase involved in cell wall biosynthesis